MNAPFPGISPATRKTHSGFIKGSRTGIKIDSRAVTCCMAFAYKIYGMPNCMIPSNNKPMIDPLLKGRDSMIQYEPKTPVRIFPSKMDSKGESSFCIRNAIARPAKAKPEQIAMILPFMPEIVNSSIKNKLIPMMTVIIASQSIVCTRSFRITPEKSATQIGPVYCSKIALAELVILFASTNKITVNAYMNAPES